MELQKVRERIESILEELPTDGSKLIYVKSSISSRILAGRYISKVRNSFIMKKLPHEETGIGIRAKSIADDVCSVHDNLGLSRILIISKNK